MMLMSVIFPGIEVLNEYEYTIGDTGLSVFWTICFGAILLIALFHAIISEDSLSGSITTSFAIVMSSLVLIYIFNVNGFETKIETRYDVTISDEVKLTEFNEKYEIIEQKGKIYTIREKD